MKSEEGTERLYSMAAHLVWFFRAAGISCTVAYDERTEFLYIETDDNKYRISTAMSSSRAAVKDIFKQSLNFIDELI